MKQGKAVYTPTSPSLADGLTVPTVGVNALATGAPLIDKMVTVSEAWIAIAILRLIEQEKAVVEGGGAMGLAALLAGMLPELKGKKVVTTLCGGNIDTTLLGRCLERGMAADGRLVTFSVTVSDRPGGIAELDNLQCWRVHQRHCPRARLGPAKCLCSWGEDPRGDEEQEAQQGAVQADERGIRRGRDHRL